MNNFMGVFVLLLLTGCCSTGSHRVAKKSNANVEAATDMQGKATSYKTEMFNFKCEKD